MTYNEEDPSHQRRILFVAVRSAPHNDTPEKMAASSRDESARSVADKGVFGGIEPNGQTSDLVVGIIVASSAQDSRGVVGSVVCL